MAFLFRGNMANSPFTYLFKGLFPNLSRQLSGSPRCTTKHHAQANRGFAEKKETPKEGVTEPTAEERAPVEQRVAPGFISPHPVVTFAELPAICGVQSDDINAASAFDLKRPVSPSLKASDAEEEAPPSESSFGTPGQVASTYQQSPDVEAESSSRRGSFDTRAQSFRPESRAGLDLECQKRLNRHSLPALSTSHSRNVSTSSNETLVGSPNNTCSPSSPVLSRFGQMLQETAEKIIGEKQPGKIRGLEGVVEEMRLKLADQTKRAEKLQSDLQICERDRELNLNTALRLYRNPGTWVMVERSNLVHQIEELKLEVSHRDSQIWYRNQLIEALRLDLVRYADQEQWVLLRQCFYALQQKYGQMPRDFRNLEQKYQELDDEHVDLSSKFKKLEGDHTELQAQRDQISDERDQLEDVAETYKQSSEAAAARYWALTVQRDQIVEQKAESEKKFKAHEQVLAELAARMFKRIIFLSGVLDQVDVDPMDDELRALCQLAHKHLGLEATGIVNSFGSTETDGANVVGDERDEFGERETHAGDLSASMFTPESNIDDSTIPIAGPSDSSSFATTDREDVPESLNAFDARRRREVAAAEDNLLGPLGLGFDNGSPMLKTVPRSGGGKISKISKGKGLSSTSPVTPRKTWADRLTSGADGIDQVTPARTGGTSGIARDEWRVAGIDLQGFTEIFRGPRAQPINIVSLDVGTRVGETSNRLEAEDSCPNSEERALLSTNENGVREKGLMERMKARSDIDNTEDDAVLEGDRSTTSGSEIKGGDEDNRHRSAAVLDNSAAPGSHEGGFVGDLKLDNHSVTRSPTPANGTSSDIWRETSFGIGKQQQNPSDCHIQFATSPAAALQPESSVEFDNFKSSPKMTFGEGSPTFQNMEVRNETMEADGNAISSLSKEAFNAPRFEDFDFGASSGGDPFVGMENRSFVPAEPASESAPTGIINLSSSPLASAGGNAPPRFEHDFNFSDSNGAISFTATQIPSPSPSPGPSAPASETKPASASPIPSTSLAENNPSTMTTQTVDKASNEELSDHYLIESNPTESNTLDPNTSNNNNKNPKGRKPQQEQPKKQEPKSTGPNRSQRRAASRERKAAEKKAQAAASNAKARGRNAVAMAMMGR